MTWDVFLALKDMPGIFTEKGVPVDTASFASMQKSLRLSNVLSESRIVAIRLYEESRVMGTEDMKMVVFSVRTEEGKWIPNRGMPLLPRNTNLKALLKFENAP